MQTIDNPPIDFSNMKIIRIKFNTIRCIIISILLQSEETTFDHRIIHGISVDLSGHQVR